MLILTRKMGESLIIQDNIRILVLGLRGKQVRLGIEAPEDVLVLREEIFQRAARENLEAARFEMADLEALVRLAQGILRPGAGLPRPPGEVPAILVECKHLGPVQVGKDQVFTFAAGLPGFPGFRCYAVISHPRVAPFLWLQSLEDPGLALVVAEPESLGVDSGITAAALKDLAGESPGDLMVLAILTLPPGRPLETTANLTGPLLLNFKTRQGRQAILEDSQPSQKHRVLPPPGW